MCQLSIETLAALDRLDDICTLSSKKLSAIESISRRIKGWDSWGNEV